MFVQRADVDLFYLCTLVLPVCACAGEPRCDYTTGWGISAPFNRVGGDGNMSEGITLCTSARASDELWPVGTTERRAKWPYWGFYCYTCTDTVTFASWGFTL